MTSGGGGGGESEISYVHLFATLHLFSTIVQSCVIFVKRFVTAHLLGYIPLLTSQNCATGLEEPATR